jgi:hypothetical protein
MTITGAQNKVIGATLRGAREGIYVQGGEDCVVWGARGHGGDNIINPITDELSSVVYLNGGVRGFSGGNLQAEADVQAAFKYDVLARFNIIQAGESWTKARRISTSNFYRTIDPPTPAGVVQIDIDPLTSETTLLLIKNDILLKNPTSPAMGRLLCFVIRQSSPVAFDVTLDTSYRHNYSNANKAAGKRIVLQFIYDGSLWVQINGGADWM